LFLGNHERAWNDPPVFAYQPGSATKDQEDQANQPASGQKKTLLNKRVAFPLTTTGSAPTVQILQPGGLPPPCLPPTLPPSSTTPSVSLISDATANDSVEKEDVNMANLKVVQDILNDCVKKYLDADKVEDITKRLKFLFSSWEDKLNTDIRRRLVKMCELLQEKNFSEAETFQIALVVDYTTECSTWIAAIKFIISEMKEKC